jgi:membrane-associated protease RseP (regulator of RpoE activity)
MPDPLSPHPSAEPPARAEDLGSTPGYANGARTTRADSGRGAFAGVPYDLDEPEYQPVWVATARTRNRVWLHWLLFVITVLTTTWVGIEQWRLFKSDFGFSLDPAMNPQVSGISLILNGLWYGATIMVILGAHELGHYVACRHYRIDASPPYFIPLFPYVGMTGTLGAFIRIRQPITSKRVLFDIGIAGPLAGFAFAVPALFLGIAWSTVVRVPATFVGLELGEPLLFKLAAWLLWGPIPTGYSLNMHPMAFAAWFGLLATVLNLFPIGQLDGGHIAYTVLGRRSAMLTKVMAGVVIALTVVSLSWLLWSVLLVVMLFVFGAQHPPTLDEHQRLDRTRMVLVAVACAIFVLCFMPAPIQPLDLIK